MISASRFSSQRRVPRRFSTFRLVAAFAILFFFAYYAAILLLLRFPGLPEEAPSQPSAKARALSLAEANVATNERMLSIERPTPTAGRAAPRSPRSEIADALAAPIAPAPSPVAGRTASVILTAPRQVADGSTFEVSVGVPAGSGVQTAHFRLSYDDDALEMLDMIDETGTTLPALSNEPGKVDLNLDVGHGPGQAPAIRFLARTGTSRSVQIAVAAELWDQAGNAIPSATVDPHSIIVDP